MRVRRNDKIVTISQMFIFKWRFRCSCRRSCLNSLLTAMKLVIMTRRPIIIIKLLKEHATPLYICRGVVIERFIFTSNLPGIRLPWECHGQSQETIWRHCVIGFRALLLLLESFFFSNVIGWEDLKKDTSTNANQNDKRDGLRFDVY